MVCRFLYFTVRKNLFTGLYDCGTSIVDCLVVIINSYLNDSNVALLRSLLFVQL